MRSGPAPMPSFDKLYWPVLVRAPPSHLGCLDSLHLTVRICPKFLSHCDMQHCVNIKGPGRWLLYSVSPRAAIGCKSARNARVILSNHVTGTPRPSPHHSALTCMDSRGFRSGLEAHPEGERLALHTHTVQTCKCLSGYRVVSNRGRLQTSD